MPSRFVRSFALLLLLSLAACGAATKQEPAATTAAPTAAAPSPAATAYPLTLRDGLGRSVTLAAAPGRIVSLAPSNTEILFAIGAGDQVVGVTKYCNFPAAAKERAQIGGFSAKTISVEAIVALRPDVVFAGDDSQLPVIEALDAVGIPVIAFKAASFDDVYANIRLAGQATDHAATAETITAGMRERVAAVAARTAAIPAAERLSAFYEVFDEPLMTAGPHSFIGQLIELAGATNIFADASGEYPEISAEQVVALQPDVIVGPQSRADSLAVAQLAQRPGWSGLTAVKDGRVILIDSDTATRAGPRLADALEALAAALYPGAVR